MIRLLYIVFVVLMVIGSIAFTKFLLKKVKLNRWIVAFTAFLVLIVPAIAFPNMSSIIWNALILIFCVLCIMFFEITKNMFENNQIKGIVRFDKPKK